MIVSPPYTLTLGLSLPHTTTSLLCPRHFLMGLCFTYDKEFLGMGPCLVAHGPHVCLGRQKRQPPCQCSITRLRLVYFRPLENWPHVRLFPMCREAEQDKVWIGAPAPGSNLITSPPQHTLPQRRKRSTPRPLTSSRPAWPHCQSAYPSPGGLLACGSLKCTFL